jgi:hypothetical protein
MVEKCLNYCFIFLNLQFIYSFPVIDSGLLKISSNNISHECL